MESEPFPQKPHTVTKLCLAGWACPVCMCDVPYLKPLSHECALGLGLGLGISVIRQCRRHCYQRPLRQPRNRIPSSVDLQPYLRLPEVPNTLDSRLDGALHSEKTLVLACRF